MASEIDKRVVQMQFDNRDFEKNCQASLSTLEKLKMALNFDGAKGLDSMAKAANKIDLSNLSKGAEAVEVKFNAMNVAGMTAISELTKGFLGLGKTIWNSTFGLMKSGGMARTLKIEQAVFQMKALAKNIKGVGEEQAKVNALIDQMKDSIDRSVTGTAYGYDAAASVASQLMASGLTDSNIMYNHLRAIAGAAAMTGRSFEDIGNIFTTVASNGRLMTMQLRQFSAAGLNLSATLAQSLGKTEEEINEMVTKGKISFEDFSDALYKAFGEAAGHADDTFSGVTTNIQAQIKRIGQIFTDPFVEHAVPFLKEVKNAIRRLHAVVKPLGKTFELVFSTLTERAAKNLKNLEIGRLQSILYGIENIFASLFMLVDQVRQAFATLFPKKTLSELNQAATDFELFTRQLIPSKETLEGLKQTLIFVLSPLRMVFNILVSIWKNALKPLSLVLVKFLGAILRLGNALKPFTRKLVESLTSFKLLDSVLQIIAATIAIVVNSMADFISYIAMLLDELANSKVLNDFAELLQSVGEIISTVLISALLILFNIVKNIFDYINISNIEALANKLYSAFQVVILFVEQGLMTILGILNGLAESSKIFGDIWEVLKNSLGLIKDFFSGEDYNKRMDKIKKSVEDLGKQLKVLAGQFVEFVKSIDMGKVLLVAFALGIIFLVWSLKEFTDAATGLVKNVSSIASTFAGFKKALATVANYNGVFQILLGIAIALGAFASALTTISQIPADALMRSAVVLGIFAAAIMGFAVAMVILQKSMKESDTKTGLNILMYVAGIAAAMLFLSLAVKTISTVEMDFKKAIVPFLTIIGLMGGLVASTIIMSRYAKEMKVGAISILAFAAAMKILVSALEQMTKIDIDKIEDTLMSFLSLMVVFGASTGLATLGGMTFGSGFGFIGAALSILILVGILKKLSSYDYDEMLDSLKKLALLFTPVIAFIIAAGIAQKVSGRSNFLKRIADTIASITFTVIAMTIMVEALGRMDPSELKQGMTATMMLGLLLSKMIMTVIKPFSDGSLNNPSKVMFTTKTVFALAAVVASMSILLGTLAAMCMTLGNETAIKGLIPTMVLVSLVFGGITLMLLSISKESDKIQHAKVGPILAVILGVIAIVSAVTLLAVFMDAETMLRFTYISVIIMGFMVALGFVLDGFSKLTKDHVDAISPAKQKMTTVQVLGVCGSIIAIMGAVGGLVYAWAKSGMTLSKLTEMWPLFAALGVLIAAAAGFVRVATKTTDVWRFAPALKAISGVLLAIAALVVSVGVAIGGIIYISRGMPIEETLGIIASVGIVISVMLWAASKFAKETGELSGSDIAKSSLAFLSAAGAFVLMVGALAVLAYAVKDINLETLKTVATMVSVPFIALLVAITLITKFAQKINYEVFADEIQSIGKALLMGAGAFAIIAVAISAVVSVGKDITKYDLEGIAITMIAVLASFVALIMAISAFVIVGKAMNIESTEVVTIAAALVVASSSFLIIAGAISMLAVVSSKITKAKRLENMLGAIIGAAIVLMSGMVACLLVTRKSNGVKWKDYIFLGLSIAAASSAFLVIATSLAMVAKICSTQDMEGISQVMSILIGAVIGFGIIMAVLMAISKNVSGINIVAIAGSFVLMASSLLIIVKAMETLTNLTYSMSVGDLLALAGILKALLAVFTVMALIGGILDTLGTSVLLGVVALVGAFTLFSVGVMALAEAGKSFVETITMINNTDISAEKISKNITNSVKGIAQAIYNCKDEILAVVEVIILGIIAIIGAQQVKMAIQAVAFVTSFLVGLAACMPIILLALDSIMQQMNDYWSKDKGEEWKGFGENIGKLIVEGFCNAFLGLAEWCAKIIVDSWNKVKDTDLGPFKFGDVVTFAMTGAVAGPFAGAVAVSARHGTIGGKREDSGSSIWTTSTQMPVSEKYLKEEQASEAMRQYRKELRKMAGFDSFDFGDIEYSTKAAKRTAEEWADIIDYINDVQTKTAIAGEDLGEEWDRLIKRLQIPEQYMSQLTSSYDYDKDKLIKALKDIGYEAETTTVSIETLYASPDSSERKTLTKDVEETADAVADVGEEAEQTGFSFEKMASDIKNGIDADAIGDNLKSGLSSINDIFEPILGDLNINPYKSDLKSFGGDIGSVLGISASKEFDDDIKTTIAYWTQYGDEVINNLNQKRWQDWKDDEGKGFKDLQTAAQYKLDTYMKETYGDTSVGHKSIMDYLKDTFGITDATDELSEVLDNAGESMLGLGDSTDDTKSKFKEFTNSLKDSIKNSLNIFDAVSEEEEISAEEMLYRMFENTRKVGEWARHISELAARGMSEGLLNELKDMGPAGAAKVNAFVNMTDEQLQMANRRYAASAMLPDYATNKIVQSYKDAGYNASLGFSNGIDQKAADEAMTNLGGNSLDALKEVLDEHSPSKKTEKIGEFATMGLAQGIISPSAQMFIRSASMKICDILLKTMKQNIKPDSFRVVSTQMMEGFNVGIDTMIPKILSKITAFAARILSTFGRILQIHSPSRAMEELGEYTMEGFGMGMENGSTDVESLTEKTATDILDAMKANIASVTDGWSEDNVYSPVIRPVFDMDAIGQGYTDIQTWFANAQGLNLSGNISRLTPTSRDETDTNQQLIDAIKSIDNHEVVEELVALRNDISELQSAMSGMQVVMNSGALVGQIVDDMDRALGSRAILNSRGRY